MKKAIQKLTFKWKENSRVKTKPEVAAKELERLRAMAEQKEERFGAAHVVAAARVKRNPLHKEFEWDDAKAADSHRLTQAGYIIRSLEVVITKERGGKVESSATLRQYTSLGSGAADGDESKYHNTREAMSDAELQTQIKLKVWRQLINLKTQYQNLLEFAAVWAAIDEAEEKMAAVEGKEVAAG